MATIQEEVQKYKAQTQQYDAGRPTTPSGNRPGLKVAQPQQSSKFQPAESAGMAMPAPARQPIAQSGPPPRWTPGEVAGTVGKQLGDDARAVGSAVMGGLRAIRDVGEKVTGGEYLVPTNTVLPRKTMTGAPAVAGLQAAESKANLRPKTVGGSSSSFASTQNTNSPAANWVWAGNYAASGPDGQGIYKDPQTGRTSIRLTGEAGDKFMQDQNKLIAEGKGKSSTAEDMAARRKAMGEYGGMFRQDAQEIPRTARPGITLQSTPVEYKREASGPKTVGGLPAEETFTPQPAQQQRAAMPTMTGNPLVDQRNMEASLAQRQAEIIETERNTPGLIYAPGSRDYISPTLSEADQRAAQIANDKQRRQDMDDARDNAIAQMSARDAGLAYAGVPSDATRNQSMAPYAARRTDINTRDAMLARAQDQERTSATVADNAATRDAEMQRAQMEDSTTRQGQAIDQETNRINAEIAAQSKAMDRETTLKAALLKAENTKDPVLLKKLDGYNSWLESVMAMGQTPTPEQMIEAQKTYGVAELFAAADPYAKLTIPAPAQK